MRVVVLLALITTACSFVFGVDRYRGGTPDGGPPPDAGPVDAGPECTIAVQCVSSTATCASGRCVECDGDRDGYLIDDPACAGMRGTAAPDCDDLHDDV